MKIDMHVHSKYSFDSPAEPELIVHYARLNGMDGICVVDHNSYLASEPFEKIAEREGFPVFRGAEYTSEDGHLLIFGVNDDSFNMGFYLPAQEIIDHVNSKGGVVIPAHPYDTTITRRMCGKVRRLRDIPALEGMNGRMSERGNYLATRAALQMGLHRTGGSDAHIPEFVGRVYTKFDSEIENMEQLVLALREGNYGPIENGFQGGD